MGHNIRITSGPAIEQSGRSGEHADQPAARATCSSSTRSTASAAPVEEVLYPAMEDYALDIMIGKGPSARSIRLDLPKFTLIGGHHARGAC